MSSRERERRRSPRREHRDRERRPRERSVSPPRGGSRHRSPRREPRNRDDDRYDRRSRGHDSRHRHGAGGGGGGGGGGYHRGGGGNRGRSQDRPAGPMPYKHFISRLPDHILPADAEKEYQVYLSDFWGSEARREFEVKKDDPKLRQRFDPREIAKLKEARAAKVAEASKEFLAALASGELDPEAEDFCQGAGPEAQEAASKETGGDEEMADKEGGGGDDAEEEEKEEGGEEEAAKEEKDDMEEEEVKEEEKEEKAEADEEGAKSKGKEGKESAKVEEVAKVAAKAAVAPAVAWREARLLEDLRLARQLLLAADKEMGITANPLGGKAEEAAGKEGDEAMEEAEEVTPEVRLPEQPAAHLDLLLTYLWRVHGIDYYAGKEYVAELQGDAAKQPAQRMLRGPKPDGHAEDASGPSAQEFGKAMEVAWKARAEGAGPFDKLLRSEWVEQRLASWVDAQVTMIDENKWGCKLSTKLFVGRAFVIKHVHGKHAHLLEAEKEKLLDDVFRKNFLEAMEKQAPASGPPERMDGGAGAGPGRMDGGYGRMGGRHGGRGGPRGPMMGRGSPMGGRGMMGPMGGRGMMGPMGGGMMGPMGGMLVPAPGAGPLGPFIMAPGPAGMGPMMGPMAGMMGAMGMRGGQGPGGYLDLDAPRNNRAVLDYGDL